MKKITFIPVINSLKSGGKLRVAAYCRISTERESQQRSIALQIKYYTDLIQTNPEWEFSGVFYDYESGLRKEKRNGLNVMLQKAYRGEIDYIITKSISRLSRNVLDMLTIIRSLKAKGINIYFEKEDLNSLEAEKEIDIAFNGVLAQEESRNLSENVQWGSNANLKVGMTLSAKYLWVTNVTMMNG
jgi:site-specific DNA recombinase